jgi:transposase InsO family protein
VLKHGHGSLRYYCSACNVKASQIEQDLIGKSCQPGVPNTAPSGGEPLRDPMEPEPELPAEDPPRVTETVEGSDNSADDFAHCSRWDLVLVICDKCSGRIFGYPTRKTATAADIAEIIDAKLINEMGRGVMMDIRCDNDPRFGQKVFGNLMAMKGVKISKTSPGHSLSNATAERSILALEILLRGMCITARHWLSRLPFALFALNTRPMNRLGGLYPRQLTNLARVYTELVAGLKA